MSWKSPLVGSALALGVQTAIANKPLPCPTTGPLQDTASVVQSGTRQKIENRLRAIDEEKRHQVVVITVKNVEEYWYGSIEEMANNLGNGCKVWYRGENTGVVVLYTQVPSRYRIENAGTERYITDAQSGRILNHSKSDGVCKKEDVSCRLNDITGEIDKLIRREFPNKQAVVQIDSAVKAHDEAKSSKEMNEFIGTLGIGGVIIVVLGWGAFWVTKWIWTIKRRNRRKKLKQEILELSTRVQVEKQKYPSWFQNQYIRRSEDIMKEISEYSDDHDRILDSERMKRELDKKLTLMKNIAYSWGVEFSTIQSRLEAETNQFNARKARVSEQNTQLISGWFLFSSVNIPSFETGNNPAESLSIIEQWLRSLSDIESSLTEIPRFYESVKGFDTKLQSSLVSLQTENTSLSSQYQSIFGKVPAMNIAWLVQWVASIVSRFQDAYQKKNIDELRSISATADSVLNPLHQANRTLREWINWYGSMSNEIARREKQLASIKPNAQYSRDASAYAEKTGKRNFVNFDLVQTLGTLQGMLGMIKNLYTQKQWLDKLDKELSNFDNQYSKVQEYIGLGAALAAIIAEEIRRQEEAAGRQREEEERRRREAEEGERRRRRREEEEEEARRRRDDENSRNIDISLPVPSPDWNSWGGGGFSWWGATSD
jgi:uncharacterized membrane protein YgcG